MSIYTSLLTAGTNSHAESSENGNAVATDLLSPGVHGVITNTSGVAPTTGAFGVNAQASPDMTVAVSSGVAYVTATPSSQNSQNLRVRNTASANVTISANSSGSTKYDWLYIQVDATKAANPASDASDVATLVTSRSSSSTTDNGTPPTYGTLLAVITVANGASSITNGNIADLRVRSVAVGGINDTNGNEIMKVSATSSAVNEVTFTNAATGSAPQIAASGNDTNIDLKLAGKGTGVVRANGNPIWQYLGSATNTTDITTTATTPSTATQVMSCAVTIPSGVTQVRVSCILPQAYNATSTDDVLLVLWRGSIGGTQVGSPAQVYYGAVAGNQINNWGLDVPSAGSTTYYAAIYVNAGTGHSNGNSAKGTMVVDCC